MKKRKLMCKVFALVLAVSVLLPVFAEKAVRDPVVEGNNAFALNLYHKLAEEKGNIFFSPYSVSTALAMTYAGAGGETAAQMEKVLYFRLPQKELHQAMADVMGIINAGGKGYRLSTANALWGQTGYKFLPEFLETTRKYYGAGFQEVNYREEKARETARKKINKWVEEKTHNKIKELIAPGVLLTPLTRLVLTNAVYFKGNWSRQFKKSATKKAPFYISNNKKYEVAMMHQTGRFRYLEHDKFQALEMPYSGGDLSMVVFLPAPKTGLGGLEKDFNLDNLRQWLSNLSEKQVEVFLPRFRFEKEVLLNEILVELGMKDAFDENKADFSGMTGDDRLYITKVIQKALIDVNEEGAEAAASTGVIIGVKSVQARPHIFRADRPFLFLIRDNRTGSILFIGRMAKPR